MTFLPTNQIWRYWSIYQTLQDLKSIEIAEIDLWLCSHHVYVDSYDIYGLGRLKNALQKSGISVRTITPEQSNPKPYNIGSTDDFIRQQTIGYYINVVKLADELKVKRISINPGWVLLDEDRARSWSQVVNALYDICSMAAQVGVVVCLEELVGHPYRLVKSSEELRHLILDVGHSNLQATLDTGTVARNGEIVSDALECLRDVLGYVHLTNYINGDPYHVGWHEKRGVLKVENQLDALKNVGYSGDFALEMTKPGYFENPKEALTKTLKCLKGCGRQC